MSADIHLTIARTRKAISRAKAALTTLGRCGSKHRDLVASLQHVINELETELSRLLYAARHPKAAA